MRVGLLGYYGRNNIGDESILQYLTSVLRKNKIDYSILSFDPQKTRVYGNSIQAGKKVFFSLPKILKEFKKEDVLIVGGGGLFQDKYLLPIPYYSLLANLAYWSKVKLVSYDCGVGPITNPIYKVITRKLFEKMDIISVRDNYSKKLLKKIGVNQKINVFFDPSILLTPAYTKNVRKLLKRTRQNGKKVVINLRPWFTKELDKKYMLSFKKWGDYLIREIKKQVSDNLFFSSFETYADEYFWSDTIKKYNMQLLNFTGMTPREILSYFTKAKFSYAIGMRLHFLLFSIMSNINTLPIPYDKKVTAIIETLGLQKKTIHLFERDILFKPIKQNRKAFLIAKSKAKKSTKLLLNYLTKFER